MVRIAPVNLPYNPKTLWFDAGELELHAGCDVVVQTARGTEFGHMGEPAFEATPDQVKKLKTPLKPVLRVADDEDRAKQAELEARAAEALPVFKELAAKASEEMRPVSVEYLLDGDKAVFYFEAEERVDFRELVRTLASRTSTCASTCGRSASATRRAWWAAWAIAARSCAASAWAASSARCPSAWPRSRTCR